MASAALASRNESSWGQSLGGFMGKTLYSNPQLNPNTNPNPNPKPKPKSNSKPKKKQLLSVNGRQADELQPAVTQTASDDAYSFNQKPVESNGGDGFNHGGYINFNISGYSRSELNELSKRFLAELEQIHSLNDRIESGQLHPRSHPKTNKFQGNKRPIPFVSGNEPKRLCQTSDSGIENGNESSMKMCRQVLTKLMKHKNSWIFNKPVDAASLGLHDYHRIIKRPMDLGTVRSNMAKNLYSSPADFAADVRLTFHNAMLYNPKTDEVHAMAKQLLDRFEDMCRPILERFEGSANDRRPFVGDELQGSSWNDIPTPEKAKKSKATNSIAPISKKNERIQNQSSASDPPNPTLVQTPSPVQAQPPKLLGARGGVTVKQPKPRAKDPNKREMSMEEKQRLGNGLQNLPQEKMPQLVQIIRKRNGHLAQEGDEIELDIEALDTETLWELDRFVTNWKKMVSKTKRQALMGNNNNNNNNNNNSAAPTTTGETDEVLVSERIDVAKRPKKGEGREEDVDIGDDEMPESSFPPVEIEKDDGGPVPVPIPVHVPGNASSSSSGSSSSSSGSSSSSDSDSGSSSGSDSDADEVQS